MHKILLSLGTILATLSLTTAQPHKNIKIGASEALFRGLCEPSVSINKLYPDTVIAAAILDQVFYSFDAGMTWTRDTLRSTYGVWGDPVLLSDFKGNQYFFHLSDPTGENWASDEILDRIVCQKTTDGGVTWNNGSYMGLNAPKDQDKEWAIADPKSHAIHTSWTQFDKYGSTDSVHFSNILLSSSTDAGESWSDPIQINQFSGGCLDNDSTTEGAVPAVGPNGEVYVAWAFDDKIYFDRIEADGSQLEQDIVVADQPGGWDIEVEGLMRANGMPVTVCDLSNGPHRGTIYVNWVDNRKGNYDVWLAKSTDRGESWSKPQRINDDRSKRDQFFSWISCDPITGHLYTVFYDRRNTEGLSTEVYLAYSTDGGKHWTNELLSEEAFYTNAAIFFGDYNHIDAYGGRVRPVWTRLDNDGTMSIWTAIIEYSTEP